MASYGKGTNCDKLWRAWYGILITVLHLFLIYIGVTRYLHYKSQAFDPKYGGTWDQSGLNFTLAMLITSIACFFLFLFSSFIRTSNYANESTQIGRDTNNLHLLTPYPTWKPAIPLMTLPQNGGNGCLYTSGTPQNLMQRTGYNPVGAVPEDDRLSNAGAEDLPPAPQYDTWSGRSAMNHEQFHPHTTFTTLRYMRQDSEKRLSIHQSLRLLWHRFQRHFLPYSVVLHLLTAYCLLLPISVVHAQQIFHRALPADWIWRSDLDFLFGTEDGLTSRPHSDVTVSGKSATMNIAVGTNFPAWDNLRAMSPEFFNLTLVLLLLSLRYPSVFWYTNRPFSFVFSLLLLLTGLHALIEFSAATVLAKLAWNQQLLPGFSHLRLITVCRPTAETAKAADSETVTGESGSNDRRTLLFTVGLNSIGPLALSTMGTVLFLCLFLTIFEYGYRQFTENLAVYRHYLVGSPSSNGFQLPNGDAGVTFNQTDSVHSGPMGSVKSNPCIGGNPLTYRRRCYNVGAELLHPGCRCCLHAYAPHLCATLGYLCVLAFKIPIMYDCFQLYRITKSALMLTAPVSIILVSCAWFIAWFAFSLKPAWKFQVNLPLHTLPGPTIASHLPPVQQNGLMVPTMMNSLLRPSSVGIGGGDGDGRIMQGLMYPTSGVITPQTPNCFSTDNISLTHGGVSTSPIYACFHDAPPNTAGYSGIMGNSLTRLLRFPNAMDMGAANSSSIPLLSGLSNGLRTGEYLNEDAEATSSGRQSGNNYVCLQTALGGGGVAHGVLVPPENGILVTRLLQPATPSPQPPPAPPPPISSAAAVARLTDVPLVNRIHSSGAMNLLSSPSSVGPMGADEEDGSSTNTVQLNSARLNGSPLGPYHMMNMPKLPLSGLNTYSDAMSDRRPNAAIIPQPITPYEDSTRALSATEAGGLPRVSLSSPRSQQIHTTISGSTSLAPRVTFKDKVDMIANTSPSTSEPGSQNTSNDSGIDNFKCEQKSVGRAVVPSPTSADGSGTYDNAFPSTFRSSVLIRNPSQSKDRQTNGDRSEATEVPTNSSNPRCMNDSFYAKRQPVLGLTEKFAGGPSATSVSTPMESHQTIGMSHLAGGTLSHGAQFIRPGEMIGDANNSFQSSSTEPFPLLLPGGTITDETQEPRLCSQV
ncbi:hypothetical protein CRM22_006478 [Opisthorchis felineus]|uniref:Transmembrane protein n=1 Tax=Opisthorchis felineus TaxID=147828 RepID=A0A4S2LKX6_OPIFE|nr:hypothetical protein CRM22_006478 [Opisthorchis felineus]